VRRRTPHRALTEFRLCKEFGWTPCELGRQSAKTVEEFVLILSETDRQADEEMVKARREVRLRAG
jgi:hypothetical protein